MPSTPSRHPVTFVWPGDLHLETDDRENFKVAQWMVREVNQLIQPHFVQFAGDNVQHATEAQFDLFKQLCDELTVPWYPLVGDHDAHHDPGASAFQANVGELYGALSLGGYRFIRLDTMQSKPLGIAPEQIAWFQFQLDTALARGEKIIIFQHHYPFQIWEDYSGPGIDRWRELVTTRPVTAIFAGHTHYGQIANDGHNLSIASRSIGDPEGGPAGYSVVHLDGEELAVAYRTVEDQGPLALITHPRDAILAISGKHVVAGPDSFRVRTWSCSPIESALARIDSGEWFPLQHAPPQWQGPLPGDRLSKGEHLLEVEVREKDGPPGHAHIHFAVDRSRRYTAFPRVRPEVTHTKFC
jgi:3',5'-cyclic AMP phosphodiesterase CpdA